MLKAAVIGYGVVGRNHAWCYSLDERVSLEYVCDTNEERAKEGAEKYEAKYVLDYKEVLADDSISLISTCLPPAIQYQIFKDAVNAGKNIICEKPLGIKPNLITDMVDIASKAKVVTAGIFQHRFSYTVNAVRKHILSGSIGEVKSISMEFSCNRDNSYYNPDAWRGKWETEGGGVCINQGIHTLDIVPYIFGRPLSVMGKAEHRRDLDIEVEDYAEAVLTYPNNVKAKIKIENIANGDWDSSIRVDGDKGFVKFNAGSNHKVTEMESSVAEMKKDIEEAEKMEDERSAVSLPGKSVYGNEHQLQIADFISCVIEKGRKPKVSIADAAVANEIVLAIFHSTATGEETTFPIKNYRHPVFV